MDVDANATEIRYAAVIGAGRMGTGMAIVFANSGIPVILKEISRPALGRSIKKIRETYERDVNNGNISRQAADKRLALIRPTLGYEGIAEADIAVEAVPEDLEIKVQVFHELDRVCWPEAVLATTTSTLDLDRIAAATSRPFKVIGYRYFAPPVLAREFEIVCCRATARDVIAASIGLAEKLNQIGILAGSCRDFWGTDSCSDKIIREENS